LRHPVFIIIAIALLVISLLVFTGTPYVTKGFVSVKNAFGVIAGPVLKGVTTVTGGVGRVFDTYFNLVRTKKENTELRKKVENLQIANQQMTEIQKENQRLRGLFTFSQRTPSAYLAARVIGEDLKNWYKCVIIDKGKNFGLRERMTVVTGEGLVGQVVEAHQWHSKVMVINDTNSAVDVYIEGKNTRGILEGTGQAACRLKYVRKTDQPESGDKLITSGKDGVYPKGIPVGLVTTVTVGKAGIFADIDVMLFNDYKKLDEVLVLKKP
jgi:rod shape-determining protein MreC